MNLREEILREHSKVQALKIANWIDKDEKRFAHLMQLFLQDEYRIVQRAAWVLPIVAQNEPKLLDPYFQAMVKKIHVPGVPVAVKRNVLKVLQQVTIPKKLHGSIMDTCFQLLADPKETIAVRCGAMSLLGNLSKDYPAIKTELKTVIEEVLQQKPTAGFRARAKRLFQIHNLS